MEQYWQTVISFYQDSWFWQFPATTLALSVGAFLLFATPWTLLAWLDPQWARPYRIQSRPFEVGKFFWPNLGRITVNSTVMFLLLVLSWPLIKISPVHAGELPAWWVVILQLVFFIFLDDFLYYWFHRYMHENKWLLKKVHAIHHRVKTPCALDGNHFHWFEFVMTGAIALVGPMLVGAHIHVVYAWIILRQLEAADGHAGYDFRFNPLHWLPFYDGPVFHDFHHARFKGNYAGFMSYVDRLLSTTVPEYLRYLNSNPARRGSTRNLAQEKAAGAGRQ